METPEDPNPVLTKLSSDLMKDLVALRAGNLSTREATLICRHSNTVMRAEHTKLQYVRIEERLERA